MFRPAGASAVGGPCSADEKREARRQAILRHATKLFAEEGFNHCEMERVAAEAGIAKGTLYLYFKNKEALFCACVDRGMQQLQIVVQQAADVRSDPLEKIPAGIFAYLKFFDDHSNLVELLIQERASFKDRKRPTYFEHRDANRGTWRDLYKSLMVEGRLRSELPVERLLDTVGNLLYGTMFTNHFIGRSVPLTDQFDAIMQIIFYGLLSEAERNKRQAKLPSSLESSVGPTHRNERVDD